MTIENEATRTLIIENIDFAKRHALKFYRKRTKLGFDVEDFEGAALLGLCDAARRFRPEKGMAFQTFAYFRIKGAMFDLLREGGGIRRRYYNQIVRASSRPDPNCQSETESGDKSQSPDPTVPYAFARTISELAELMRTLDEVGLTIHRTLEGGADISYANEVSPEGMAMFGNGRAYLKKLIALLPEKQRRVLELRYFEDYSFEEISSEMGGLSKSWVSRIHTTGIDRLRELIIEDQRICKRRIDENARTAAS